MVRLGCLVAAEGAHLVVMAQEAPAGKELPQVVPVTERPMPLAVAALVMLTVQLPWLVTVCTAVEESPTCTTGWLVVVSFSDAATPVSAKDLLTVGALLVTVSVRVVSPVAAILPLIVSLQAPVPAGSVVGQSVVSAPDVSE